MKVLIDTNIMIDALTNRDGRSGFSASVIDLCAKGIIDGFVAIHSISNIYYILRKHYTDAERRIILKRYNEILKVAKADNGVVDAALNNNAISDFEDALQYASLELKNDKELVTKLLEGKYYLIDLVGEKLKNDKEFMMPILIKDPFYIRNAGSEIKRDIEIALYIIRVNPDLFRYLNVNLLNNPEFVNEAKKVPGFEKKYLLTNKCDII